MPTWSNTRPRLPLLALRQDVIVGLVRERLDALPARRGRDEGALHAFAIAVRSASAPESAKSRASGAAPVARTTTVPDPAPTQHGAARGTYLAGLERVNHALPAWPLNAKWPREESNLRTQVRSLPLYPLSYGA
jgi:hypothetical protein